MPAIIVDGKILNWEKVWTEVRDDKPLSQKIQSRIEELKQNARRFSN